MKQVIFPAQTRRAGTTLAYWHQDNYYAAGAGAVGTIDKSRVTREKHPARYISAIQNGHNAHWRTEHLGDYEWLTETWMLGLRLRTGVPIANR